MNLLDLQSAFKPLIEISHREKTIDVAGLSITLRSVSPKEEADIQNSLPSISGDEEGSSAMEFVDVFRKETLARSIVQVGDLDLRGVDYVETGEKTSNGTPMKVRKEEAVSQMVEGWSRPILTKVFESFTELVEELENDLNDKLQITPPDTEAEKEILKERIIDIERNEAMRAVSDRSGDVLEEVSKVGGGLFEEALKDGKP